MPRIDEYRNLGSPLRGDLFRVTFSGVPAGGGGDETSTLVLKLMSAGLPGKNTTDIEVNYGRGVVLRYAGPVTYEGTWSTLFKETENVGTLDRLNTWLDLAYNTVEGTGNPKEMYEVTALIETMTSGNAVQKRRRLVGVFPSSTPGFELNATSPDPIELTIDWKYDYWEDVEASG